MPPNPKTPREVRAHKHRDKRLNIPTAEVEPVMRDEDKAPKPVRYKRNPDLDPQLVWRGKDEQDSSDLVTQAPPLYIQEKVHPKALIDDLMAQTAGRREARAPDAPDLFADFNGLADPEAKAEFYAHQQNWTNRMILGDGLQVMASLAEREGLRGKVQCIYLDPPYGIRFNSNFQWSTRSRDVRDGKAEHVTREPEMVKAFRDTWRDGIHSYLSYLRDRLIVARDLLLESGSIFVQIGDENVHRVRAVMDEVFGDENFVAEITSSTTTSSSSQYIDIIGDYVLWYSKKRDSMKYRSLFLPKSDAGTVDQLYRHSITSEGTIFRNTLPSELSTDLKPSIFRIDQLTSQTQASTTRYSIKFQGKTYDVGKRQWATPPAGMNRLIASTRVTISGESLVYIRRLDDYPVVPLRNLWTDTSTGGFTDPKIYVVQTNAKVIQRCLLMTTDPGDLVLDPTCGSGTTAYVAEQWGRRWITIDTSRVALALARARIMGARYPFYLLRDTEAGVRKEAELRHAPPLDEALAAVTRPGHLPDLRQGFVYERVPHITLKSIANNAEIDVIWDQYQEKLEPLRARLNTALGEAWEEWEIPREPGKEWSKKAVEAHGAWWEARIARQKEIDTSIAAGADHEYLYDKPYRDAGRVRVAGPFTVESLSPHRVLSPEGDGPVAHPDDERDFAGMVLENLKTSGVQQMEKGNHIAFSSLEPWPGKMIAAEGRYAEGENGADRRAGIFIGPEFGTIQRADLAAAVRECADAGFDILIACGFAFSAQCANFTGVGRIRALRARMNPDLHMGDLKNTGTGNLFVVFGEPDIEIENDGDQIRVRIKGVDVFRPGTGEIESSGPEGIACWFIDTDYNEESFFVRHAYFLGANDPYKALKTTLKAEIDEEAWATLNADISRPFPRPETGRIAVKVINHLGDEVMKVLEV